MGVIFHQDAPTHTHPHNLLMVTYKKLKPYLNESFSSSLSVHVSYFLSSQVIYLWFQVIFYIYIHIPLTNFAKFLTENNFSPLKTLKNISDLVAPKQLLNISSSSFCFYHFFFFLLLFIVHISLILRKYA